MSSSRSLRDQLAACCSSCPGRSAAGRAGDPDGQAGRDDEEAAGEVLAAGPANGVERLPGDQHRHDGRLAGAGGELQREPFDVQDSRRR